MLKLALFTSVRAEGGKRPSDQATRSEERVLSVFLELSSKSWKLELAADLGRKIRERTVAGQLTPPLIQALCEAPGMGHQPSGRGSRTTAAG